MATRITYLGCEDGTPPVHAWKHPVSGDMFGLNVGRPLLIDPAKALTPEDTQFLTDIIAACTADDHFRVEDVPDEELPYPISSVAVQPMSPGQGMPPDYVAPPASTTASAQGMRAERAEPKSSRRERGE
jgi:hypothetical protein